MNSMKNHQFSIDKAYAIGFEEILQQLSSAEKGLHSAEAAKRLEIAGPNRLPEPFKEGPFKRFFKHFHDLFIYVLITAAVVTLLLQHWLDSGVILAVVFINAVIGFIQEGKAEQALAGIRGMLSLKAHVLRDGKWREIDASELVPGDIVRLKSGDRVPADLRFIEATSLRIEESALTGESQPVEKNPEPVEADAGIGDRNCMGYSGTMVAGGRGLGVVSATGPATEIGRINAMIAGVETLETPVTLQMKRFAKFLSAAILCLAVLMGLIGWLLHSFEVGELFLAAIAFAVAAIPEGLPAVLTITLALGVQRMAQRNAIIRKLNAVETLGSVTVICSDKTGTLTRNEMTVRHVVTRAGCYDLSGTGYEPVGEVKLNDVPVTLEDHGDLHALVEVMGVCNDAELRETDGRWQVIGEPTEGSLQTLVLKTGFNTAAYERLDVVPFESENKFMVTLNKLPSGENKIMLKGAPDRLLERCETQLGADGSTEPLRRDFWNKQMAELGGQGLRVLAAASRNVDASKDSLSEDDLKQDMVFIGMVGIIDPPRPEAIDAIKTCYRAGIRVIMITGDHAGTASAIGKEMGIGDGQGAVTGAELEYASDEELKDLVKNTLVFARTSPEHKLRLVTALQANGEVVAMTGDGVNDAPALKRADVGVAMGIKGTEATKEAARIVLADDNFTSIEHAIEEGRTIYDNLRKAILFILPTNGAEGLVILAAVVFGLVLPLTPVQILWVNMATAITLALALAFEPAEPNIMQRPPRRTGEAILSGAFLWRISFVSMLIGGATIGVFLIEAGNGLDTARTLAVNTLVFSQIFYLFNCRHLQESSLHLSRLFANRVAWLTILILLVLQAMFVYAPVMQSLFGSVPLSLRHWLIPIGIGAVLFLVVEAEKAITGQMNSKSG
jgi:magnesium-transporting ATPase (P-type)